MYHGRAEGSIEAVGNADERRTAFYKDLYAKSNGIVVYGFRNDCSLFFYFAVQKMLLSSGKCSAISSILQWRMLQSLSSVATVTFLLCLRRFSWARFILYFVYSSYWLIPFSFMVSQSLSYRIKIFTPFNLIYSLSFDYCYDNSVRILILNMRVSIITIEQEMIKSAGVRKGLVTWRRTGRNA